MEPHHGPVSLAAVLSEIREKPLRKAIQESSPSSEHEFERPLPKGVPSDLDIRKADPELIETIRSAISEFVFPVFVYGPVGCGKTCAAACIYCTWRRSEVRKGTIRWKRCGSFLDEILKARFSGGVQTFGPGGESIVTTEAGLFEMWNKADFCILDDFATTELNNERYEAVLALLDARVGKPTIITSNRSPLEVKAMLDDPRDPDTARIASRIASGTVIEALGRDRRIANAKFKSVGSNTAAVGTRR